MITDPLPPATHPPAPARPGKRKRVRATLYAILALGGLACAVVVLLNRPASSPMPPVTSIPIPPPEPKSEPEPPTPPAPAPAPVANTEPEEPTEAAPTRGIRRSEITQLPTTNGDRVPVARARVEKDLRELFTQAGLSYPPERLFIRAFKREAELELWAAPSQGGFRLIATYGVTCSSGGPGPKRREGDGQTPEGFYVINRLNPRSSFHLSMGLNYPNDSDRILSDREKPGYDIFIHGRASSIGCLPLGDDRIEEVFIAATDTAHRPIHVHVFPARMNAADWPSWRDAASTVRSDLVHFWNNLQPGWEYFERYRQLPKVTVGPDGSYEYSGTESAVAQDLRQ